MTSKSRYTSLERMLSSVARSLRPEDKMSVSDCAEKYRFIRNIGSYVGPWSKDKTPYMVEVGDNLESMDYTALVFVGPAQAGKALCIDTDIMTPEGFRKLSSIKEGQYVIGDDGRPAEVTFKSPTMLNKKCYEILFDTGEKIVACSEHKWEVRECLNGGVRVLTTQQMVDNGVLNKSKTRSRYAVNTTKAVNLPEKILPLDPYVFGYWLGDGDTKGFITCGEEDLPQLQENFKKRGFNIRIARYKKRAPTVFVNRTSDGMSLRKILNSMGVREDKTIPNSYILSSIEQRREFLRGLCDSDGYISRNSVVFGQCREHITQAFYEVSCSLGYKVHRNTKKTFLKGVPKQDSYEARFTIYDPLEVVTYSRKISMFTSRGKKRKLETSRKYIKNITPVDSVPVACIQVANKSHLYLAGRGQIVTHNTDMFCNWVLYTQICDPSGMILYQTTQTRAKNFSEDNIDKLLRHTKALSDRLLPGKHNRGIFKKRFVSGTLLNMSWPTITELSGRSVRRVFITDYDRIDENIGGEGDCFTLARKRTRTFKKRAMTVVESTPGEEIENPNWQPSSKHEAPPAKKIMSLYNEGTRKRLYWKCTGCEERFEPKWSLMRWDEDAKDTPSKAKTAYLECPHCEKRYYHDGVKNGKDSKYQMNLNAKWLADYCWFDENDEVQGEPPQGTIDSYWMTGVCAAFSEWSEMVEEFLNADSDYERTGSEEKLKTFFNTTVGVPYQYKADAIERLPEELMARAKDLGERVVPRGVRFLIANIDVQKNRFVVQVHGYGEHGDVWIIDRFNIIKSKRKDEDGERLWVKPGVYVEDWKLIIEQVLEKTYPLSDTSGRHMEIKAVSCDSAGEKGVTSTAYEFFRYLKNKHEDNPTLYKRFILTKGSSTKTGPRTNITYPDSKRKDRKAEGRGEVPVMMLNTFELKNKINMMLDREESGGGRVNFPDWLEPWFYEELTAEKFTPKGWEQVGKRNESWDLLMYSYAVAISRRFGALEQIDWENPVPWAKEWDENPFVTTPEGEKSFDNNPNNVYDESELADILG